MAWDDGGPISGGGNSAMGCLRGYGNSLPISLPGRINGKRDARRPRRFHFSLSGPPGMNIDPARPNVRVFLFSSQTLSVNFVARIRFSLPAIGSQSIEGIQKPSHCVSHPGGNNSPPTTKGGEFEAATKVSSGTVDWRGRNPGAENLFSCIRKAACAF